MFGRASVSHVVSRFRLSRTLTSSEAPSRGERSLARALSSYLFLLIPLAICYRFEIPRTGVSGTKADAFNQRLDKGWGKLTWGMMRNRENKEEEWRKRARKRARKRERRRASLTMSITYAVFARFRLAGVLKDIGDTAPVTSPLYLSRYLPISPTSTHNQNSPHGV